MRRLKIGNWSIPALALLLLLALNPGSQYGQELRIDSTRVEQREIDQVTLDAYREDSGYDFFREEEPSFRERFLRWLFGSLNQGTVDTIAWIFKSLLIVGAALLIFFGIRRMGLGALFSRPAARMAAMVGEEVEDIHSLKFSEAILEASRAGDYRKAVRLLYLQILHALNERELIDYQIDKTNFDYREELSGTDYSEHFDELTLRYAFVWYGKFPIDGEGYGDVEQRFRAFQLQIGKAG